MNILHIIQNSLPKITGSTLRSKSIFKHQREFGKVFVATPFSFSSPYRTEIYNMIPYFRMNNKISILLRFYSKWYSRLRNILFKLVSIDIGNPILELPFSYFTKRYIRRLVKRYNIDIIHQHTDNLIGKFTLEVAKRLRIPYIYEVRGFIEMSVLATQNGRRYQDKKILGFVFNKIRNRETKVLERADFITTLSEPMKNALVKRGLNEDKIVVVPNCIDNDMLTTVEKDVELKDKFGLNGAFIIGHFGTLRWYEGIEILLEALEKVLQYNQRIKLIIVGGAENNYLTFLKKQIRRRGLERVVQFLGFVPHSEIGKYFSITDVIIIPRKNTPVCRMVTPLKPIDSMAFKTLVIASDLPALRYTIEPNQTGLLFKPEDPTDLANKILECIREPKANQHIIENAYKNILKNFVWRSVVSRYYEIYRKLTN